MTTADEVAERALSLVAEGSDTDDAVADVLACCGGRRVSVILARQRLDEGLKEAPDDQTQARAVQLLDLVLERDLQ